MTSTTDRLQGSSKSQPARVPLERVGTGYGVTYETSVVSKTQKIDEAFARSLELAANELLRDEIPFPHFFREVSLSVRGTVLRLDGLVPTYYLKSVLQNRLQRAFPEMTIENGVAVINSYGLSSVPEMD